MNTSLPGTRGTNHSSIEESHVTTQPQEPSTATPRPGDPDEQPTDPATEGNPVTPPNPVESP
jgi:hypothetical protein